MRSVLSVLLILIFSYTLVVTDAEAKRFGGGRSFGTQRSSTSYSKSQTTQAPRSGIPTSSQSTASKWLGPLAGLAVGGLLASLFMGHGLGSGIMSWLLIAGIGFLIFIFLRGKTKSTFASSTPSAFTNPVTANQPHLTDYPFTQNNHYQEPQGSESYSVPSYSDAFNPDEFLRDAKVQFIRLQACYDSKNLTDLREFTTPEVFAEIQLQLQERGNEENFTEVVSLEAEVLDSSQEFQGLIVSTRFSGMIREKRNEAPVKFDETWHFKKDLGMHWRVTGIEQN